MKQSRGICVSVGTVISTLSDETYFYLYIYIYSHRLLKRAVIQEYFKLMIYTFTEALIF